MKKLIIFVLTLFLTFTIFLSSKSANAELVPITPLYEGDILNGKELYLFQDYTSTPNFENGYISKKTISSQDVYYEENSNFNGWYKDLGKNLIDEYTAPEHEPDNPYFVFYIVFNGMLGQYLQLGLISQEPYVSTYHIKYKNENATILMETNLYNEYLMFPPVGTQTKEIEWISYDVYYPDILASFKPLTADITYNFGFESGEREGYNNGYNTGYSNGYNRGHTDGYEEGSIDTQYGVNTVVNFNQMLNNTSYWSNLSGVSITNNYANNWTITGTSNDSSIRVLDTIVFSNNDKILIKYSGSLPGGFYIQFNGINALSNETNEYIGSLENTDSLVIRFYLNGTTTNANNTFSLNAFNLTQIYGSGREPTTQQFNEDFPSNEYPYTPSDLINIDYENGYIKGQKLGYNLGYDDGKDAQATQQLTSTGWIGSIFGGISSLLNIQIFPGVTIGIIVGIPFVISLAYFVIRAFRGGGGA